MKPGTVFIALGMVSSAAHVCTSYLRGNLIVKTVKDEGFNAALSPPSTSPAVAEGVTRSAHLFYLLRLFLAAAAAK